ncbi:MAG: radical SAM family heme chaperone HemW [Peptoniphilaceae bacterium]
MMKNNFIFNNNLNSDKISLYIHIPFCESRCYYCDFCSSIISQERVKVYFNYLLKEINLYKNFLRDKEIVSIFLGGGTPSSVDSIHIKNLLIEISKISNIKENCEITIETNPNSLKAKSLENYLFCGINRFSLGAQSFNDRILKNIGRIHTKKDIFKAIDTLKEYNICNFNIDLMLALPVQNINDIKESINYIKDIKPSHISYYSLILEENTKLYNMNKNNTLNFPNEEDDRHMYHYVVKNLNSLGYKQYEISNFSTNGFQCLHNIRYWKLKNYLGIGISSHSNIDNIRFSNYDSFKNYYNSIDSMEYPISNYETLSLTDRINEFTIMGLRLNKGINLSEINNNFNIDFYDYYKREIEKNLKLDLIELKNNNIFLTDLGRDLSNKVELDFIRLE